MFKAWYHRQNFHPNFFSLLINPFYFIRRALREGVAAYAPRLQGQIMDFGCGAKPYQSLFTQAQTYIGVDLDNPGHDHSTESIDVYYDGEHLPFADGHFDGIFSSEVFEHVPKLEIILPELHRVLKPNGLLLVTVPMVWNEHELPHDYRRFTAQGLQTLLAAQGFELVEQQKTGHFALVLFQLRLLYLRNRLYTRHKYLNLVLHALFIFPFALLFWLVAGLYPKDQSLYFNVVGLYRKR